MSSERIASALENCLISPNVSDSNFKAANVVDALASSAAALRRLGLNNAQTGMGAIELLAKEVRDGSASVAAALDRIADAIYSSRT